MPVDTSPLPPALPAGQMLALVKMRRALRNAAGTMPDDSVRRAYAARAAELTAMDATRRAIVNAAPLSDEEAEYVAHRDGLAEGGR